MDTSIKIEQDQQVELQPPNEWVNAPLSQRN